MAVFLLSVVAVIAIAGIVLWLRRRQHRAVAEYAERHQPLPPLDRTVLSSRSRNPDDESTPGIEEAGLPADWLKRCRQLRNENRLDEALSLCREARPRLQAFEQEAMVYRAWLRKARQHNDRAARRRWLEALYQVAAQASCLHDPPSAADSPDRKQDFASTVHGESPPTGNLPYREIGHEKLKLLRKTDRQLLDMEFGAPLRHVSARDWLDRHENADG